MAIFNGFETGDVFNGTIEDDLVNGNGGSDTLSGGAGNDTIDGGADNDYLSGGGDDDTVFGGLGGDIIEAGLGNDSLDAGSGEDTLFVGRYDDLRGLGSVTINMNLTTAQATGGAGIDTYLNFENVNYLNVDSLTLIGTPGANDIFSQGASTADRLFLLGGDDTAHAGPGNDTVLGGAGNDSVRASNGDDRVYGGTGNDTLWGENDDDLLNGEAGDDWLHGNTGNDTIIGGTGADTLEVGTGRDILTGGDGSGPDLSVDTFRFISTLDSATGGQRDVIRDFEAGIDLIDLSNIDAQQFTAGDQDFAFIGSDRFSNTQGELRAVVINSNTLIQADIDGDGISDMDILLNGAMTLTAEDFIL